MPLPLPMPLPMPMDQSMAQRDSGGPTIGKRLFNCPISTSIHGDLRESET